MHIEWEQKVLDKLSESLTERLTKRKFMRALDGTTAERPWKARVKRKGAGRRPKYTAIDLHGSGGYTPIVIALSMKKDNKVEMRFSMGGKVVHDTGFFLQLNDIVQEGELVLRELIEKGSD